MIKLILISLTMSVYSRSVPLKDLIRLEYDCKGLSGGSQYETAELRYVEEKLKMCYVALRYQSRKL